MDTNFGSPTEGQVSNGRGSSLRYEIFGVLLPTFLIDFFEPQRHQVTKKINHMAQAIPRGDFTDLHMA
jgi:hypothetical protein